MLLECQWIHHASHIGRRQNLQEYNVPEEWTIGIRIERIDALGIIVRIEQVIDREIIGHTRISIISDIALIISDGIYI